MSEEIMLYVNRFINNIIVWERAAWNDLQTYDKYELKCNIINIRFKQPCTRAGSHWCRISHDTCNPRFLKANFIDTCPLLLISCTFLTAFNRIS